MAASVVVAATSAVAAEAVPAAAPRSEVAPEAPVVAVRGAPGALEAPEAEGADRVLPVWPAPVAVGAVRRGSAVALTSARTRSTFACWMVAFGSRTPGAWPSF